MMQPSEKQLSVTWRGDKFTIAIKHGANLKELGDKLQQLTDVKADTLRLIVPTNKGSKMLYPFSDEHSYLLLEAACIIEGKPIRMMGVPENEVEEILENARKDLRIAGFEEEEKRMRQRILGASNSLVQLPQGTYIFSDFRTLSIQGVELNPPASEALKLMHRLAADPGIVAIMNKHEWRVGIMTEMAPVGYVGVSPKCILGFNKNHGEEISLRLRTDDLNGFRKYDSIKKTLLHELAHMVYSEHDAKFYALDKQLNQEATALDWTKTKGNTLNGVGHGLHAEVEFGDHVSSSRKLGGHDSGFTNARESSVAAAYLRIANASTNVSGPVYEHKEPDPDDSGFTPHRLTAGGKTEDGHPNKGSSLKFVNEHNNHESKDEPDPDDSEGRVAMESESYLVSAESQITVEPDPDDSLVSISVVDKESVLGNLKVPSEVGPSFLGATETGNFSDPNVTRAEPNPDDSQVGDQVGDNDDMIMVIDERMSMEQGNEPDPDDLELKRIQDPVTAVYGRLQKAVELLRTQVNPLDGGAVLQSLTRIIRNIVEHPDEMKFRRIRKANSIIQRNIIQYGAATEILYLVGFSEDIIFDETGKAETYLLLKRNDPGLLWLVKSSLESSNT